MKLLVFAHVPPPFHGQSYMVKLFLDSCKIHGREAEPHTNDKRLWHDDIEGTVPLCYHVDARLSNDLDEVGAFRWTKIALVIAYCVQALWYRFRYGVKAMYYVPAPGKRAALYRDWIVMLFCRPFFRQIIFHWEAVGLGDWLAKEGAWFERWITHRLLGRPVLSVALSNSNMRDPLWFRSKKVLVVPNGIPDPFPQFDTDVLPVRLARRAELPKALQTKRVDVASAKLGVLVFRMLYLAHCTRSKGLFDALEGVVLANQQLKEAAIPVQIQLIVAGAFLERREEEEFSHWLESRAVSTDMISYVGFVSGEKKRRLLEQCDGCCFPTYYEAEGQPVTLIEAMAAGLPIVTTRWRGIPEMLPPEYEGIVAPRCPAEVARAILHLLNQADPVAIRQHFLDNFALPIYVGRLFNALEKSAGGSSGDQL